MFCRKCGAQLAEGAEYCHNCGARVVPGVASSQSENPPPVSPNGPGQPAGGVGPMPMPPGLSHPQGQPAYPPVVRPRKKSRALPVVLGVVGALLVVLVVCALVAGTSGSTPSTRTQNQGEVALTETYTDVEHGFSFQYPKAWEVVEKDEYGDYFDPSGQESALALLANLQEDFPEVNSYVVVSGFSATQEAVNHLYIDDSEFAGNFDPDASVLETSVIDLDGVDARQIRYVDEGIYYQSYFYPVDLMLYRVDFICQESQVETLRRFFDAMIGSYTITAGAAEEPTPAPVETPAASEGGQGPPTPAPALETSYIGSEMSIDCLTEFSNGRAWVQFQNSHRKKGTGQAMEDAADAALGDETERFLYGIQNYSLEGDNRAALIDATGKILWETDLTQNGTILLTIGEFGNEVTYITFNGNDQEMYYIIDVDGNVTYSKEVTEDFVLLGNGDDHFLVAQHVSNFDTDEWQLGLMDRNGTMITPYQSYESTVPEPPDPVSPPAGEMPDPNVDFSAYLEYEDQLEAYEQYANYVYEPRMIEIDISAPRCDYLGEDKYRLWPAGGSEAVVLDMANQRTMFSDYAQNAENQVPHFLTDFENGSAYAVDSSSGQICTVASDGTRTLVTANIQLNGVSSFSDGLAFGRGFVDDEGNYYESGVYCNLQGEVEIQFPQYDDDSHYYDCGAFQGGYAPMTVQGADGETYITVIDKSGNAMFELKSGFEEVFVSPDGKYVTATGITEEWVNMATVFTITGEPVLTVEYDAGNKAQEVREGLLHVADCYINVEDGSTIGLPEKRVSLYGSIFHITCY